MMVTLRLYRQHDLDLITLYKHPSFSLPLAIKNALFAYVRKEELIIKQPASYNVNNDKIAKTVQIHIQLDETKDTDIIKWLKNTKEGYRNSVLKNIIRGYLSSPCIYFYQDNADSLKDADENNKLFESNIKNITEIKGKKFPKKSSKKNNIKKVEDSELANEILNRKTVLPQKTNTVFIERIDDDEKIQELAKTEKPKNIENTNNKSIEQPNLSEENDEEDIFSMFDGLMGSM